MRIDLSELPEFQIRDDNMIYFENKVCIPDYQELKRQILNEVHLAGYTVHPGSTKTCLQQKKSSDRKI